MQGIIGTLLALLLVFFAPFSIPDKGDNQAPPSQGPPVVTNPLPSQPPAQEPPIQEPPTQEPPGQEPPAQQPSVYSGRVIVLDAGHGGTNPGAIGVTGFLEKDLNWNIVLGLKERLEMSGARVILTRWDDYDLTLQQRVDVANNNNADVFVSVHGNTNPDPNISGAQTYWYNGQASQTFAEDVQKNLLSSTRTKDKGILSAPFYVIRHTKMPAILTEVGFISNREEETNLRNLAYRHAVAEGIYNGIGTYLSRK
jgi:N-acetylmuramoyl-L-alanine amidase